MDRDDPRWASQASYDFKFLKLYDITTLGVANRLVWSCPTSILLKMYSRYESSNHLDVGPASGYYLAKSGVAPERLVLMDINANVLQYCSRRLTALNPQLVEGDISRDEIPISPKFDSVAVNFVLHCIPLPGAEKFGAVFKNVTSCLNTGGILFGGTVLDTAVSRRARYLQDLYNRKGIFNNKGDRREDVENALTGAGVDTVELEQHGSVLRFVGQAGRAAS